MSTLVIGRLRNRIREIGQQLLKAFVTTYPQVRTPLLDFLHHNLFKQERLIALALFCAQHPGLDIKVLWAEYEKELDEMAAKKLRPQTAQRHIGRKDPIRMHLIQVTARLIVTGSHVTVAHVLGAAHLGSQHAIYHNFADRNELILAAFEHLLQPSRPAANS